MCRPPKNKKKGKDQKTKGGSRQNGLQIMQLGPKKSERKSPSVGAVPQQPQPVPQTAVEAQEPYSDNTVKDVPDLMPFYVDDNVRELYFSEEQLIDFIAMTGGLIMAGVAIAAAGFGARILLRNQNAIKKGFEKIPIAGEVFDKYHRGGFESKMSRREAAMILGVQATAKPNKIKEAHKRIMIVNHPDRGGSPYLAAKINEAKDYLESNKS
ncbi:unnamed protein product, partial [Mesorhabditis belari]|uniref:DnaJ homolog subfamily C member 21 n=1 Tax=Mesorhabditis belari TaxID=2138241 RepID=A0AAF3FCB3_9BILA